MARWILSACIVAAMAVPATAGISNLGLVGTAFGDHTVTSQGSPSGINDGSFSWGGNFYGSTESLASGYYYTLWPEAQRVRSIRWVGSMADTSRTLSGFTLWTLNDGADPAVQSSWTPTSATPYLVDAGVHTKLVVLPKALSTRGVKLSYVDQTRPLTGEFEIYDQDMTALPATVTSSPSLYGGAAEAVDEEMTTSYGSGGLAGGNGFMELDLGSETAIGSLKIYFRVQGDYYAAPSAFTLQAWDSSTGDWASTPLAEVTSWGSTDAVYALDLRAGTKTQKVRLNVTPREVPNIGGGSFGIFDFHVYRPATIPGDANGDAMVDFADYLILESSYGSAPGGSNSEADFDDNGVVEFADYLVLEANFGTGAVPEPATIALLSIAGLALARRRR